MPQSYAPEFRKKIVRLHEEEGRTYKSITAEYGVRWLLRRLGICPNAYYNYLKKRKAAYYAEREKS